MLLKSKPSVLLASMDPDLASHLQTLLKSLGIRIETTHSSEATLSKAAAMRAPGVILLDIGLSGVASGELLAGIHERGAARNCSIALVAETRARDPQHPSGSDAWAGQYARTWADRLHEGIVDDIIPRDADRTEWATHLSTMQRTHALQRELEHQREAALRQVQHDRLTGTLNREAMLSILFRETDRVQRLRGFLCLVLLDIDDFGHWNTELGLEACDELLQRIATRIGRLLRSYDLLGRIGKDEFLLALPGCSTVDAVMLAERLRMDIFGEPFLVEGVPVRISACFGVTSSRGRSPVVVLREVEQTLAVAKLSGPDSLRTANECAQPAARNPKGNQPIPELEPLF